jgi:hypothetical protein
MQNLFSRFIESICPAPVVTVDQIKARIERMDADTKALSARIKRFDQTVSAFNRDFPRHRITY